MTLVQPLVWLVLIGNMMSGMTSNSYASKMLGVKNYIDFMTPGIMIVGKMTATSLQIVMQVFTSNAIFPAAAMPNWLRLISRWNPLTYAITPIRTLIIKGWLWHKIIPGLTGTFLFALLMVIISTRQFKRSIA